MYTWRDPSDTLEEYIRRRIFDGSGRDARRVLAMLGKLGWPEVAPDEYLDSRGGILLFHPTAAIVARLEVKRGLCEHPLICPRLRTYELDSMTRLELCVGLRLQPAVSRSEEAWVRRMLLNDKIDWQDDAIARGKDSRADNLGRVPLVSKDFPHGLPVIIDRDHIVLRGAKPIHRCFEDYGINPAEAQQFRAQINSLRRLIPPIAGEANAQAISLFWKQAHALTGSALTGPYAAERPLAQGWHNPPLGVYDDPYGKGLEVQQISHRQQSRAASLAP